MTGSIRRILVSCGLLGAVVTCPPALAGGTRPLLIGGSQPHRAVVAFEGRPAREPVSATPMSLGVAGVAADLNPVSLRALVRCIKPGSPVAAAPDGATAAYSVQLELNDQQREVRILRDPGGRFWLDDRREDAKSVYLLRDVCFTRLQSEWPRYHGGFSSASVSDPTGELLKVPGPFEPSPYRLDRRTLRQRVFGSIRSAYPRAEIDLAEASFVARLPKDYAPRGAAGLIVWIAPRDQWPVPDSIHKALDELGFVAIGALNSGNEHPPADRLQLALHAAQIGRSRWHIDPRRVYVIGMSGGARIATMLWAGFPEVFSAGIPIVGLGSYKNAPNPANRGEYWPAIFAKPKPNTMRLLRAHRLAPMTGPPDFNYANMVAMAEGLKRDRIALKMFIYDDMAHVMPTPDRFLEALRWIDEPYVDLRRTEVEAANEALDEYLAANGPMGPIAGGQRAALEEIIRLAPWSDPAWRAQEMLEARAGAGAN